MKKDVKNASGELNKSMLIYVMDCEYEVIKQLETAINEYPKSRAQCFTTLQKLIDAVRARVPDAVILDGDVTSCAAAVNIIRSINPGMKIILTSADEQKSIAVFEMNLTGFLLKPLRREKIEEQLRTVKHPLLAKVIQAIGKGTTNERTTTNAR